MIKNIINKYKLNTIVVYMFFYLVVLVMGSVGTKTTTSIFVAIALNLFFLGTLLFSGKQKIIFPKGFFIYTLFLVILSIHTGLLQGKTQMVMIFISSALFWLVFHNIKKSNEYILNIIYLLSATMTFFYIATLGKNINSEVSENLFHPTATSLHNHLGDIVAISLIALMSRLNTKNKYVYIIFALGAIIVAISYSRSAIASIVGGIVYMQYKLNQKHRNFSISNLMLAVALFAFIFFGLSKTTFLARPYYTQAISLLPTHPWGIGLGNFVKYFGPAQLVHSLFLELAVSIGIFSSVFFVWLLKAFKIYFRNNKNIVYQALFLGLLINFVFDRTYAVPSLFWLWFSILGKLGEEE